MTAIQKKHAPSLRFPGFIGEWCKTTIGQNFEFKNGLNKEKEYFGHGTPIINFMDVYHLTAIRNKHIDGFVELSDKEIANFSVRKGDVFFTRTSETIKDIGMSATLVEDIENCVFSGFVLRARPVNKKLDILYKSYCFSIEPVRKEIVTKSSYTTRALTSGRLLNKACFYYPSDLQEQQKIANFLSSVDTKIEQLGKKKALLEQYKKGMIQKLFSQETRFKGEQGNDYPVWEERKLGDVLDYEQPTEYLVENSVYDDGYKTPVLTAGKTFLLGYTNEKTGVFIDKLPTIIFDDFTTAFKYVDFPFKAKSSAMKMLVSKSKCVNMKFVYEAMKRVRFPLGEHKRYWISEYQRERISYPSKEEQQKIADFLSAIDKKIELVAEQLEQARTFKKGLLQQMFI